LREGARDGIVSSPLLLDQFWFGRPAQALRFRSVTSADGVVLRGAFDSMMHEARPGTQNLPNPKRGFAGVFCDKAMIFSKDYVGYLARQTVKQLVDAKMIETEKMAVLNERVTAAMVEELALEDRINDEVRVILEAFQDDMRKTGASYPEMFKKVKNELARKYKAVL
jgi:hypothetical protein